MKHIKANVSSYNYGKAGRIQTCQRIKMRANFDKDNHKQASSIHVQVFFRYIMNTGFGEAARTVYFCWGMT